jgi:DHA1 family bicyclomycin/chloramphenicol resistance-like MFS transporter
MATSWPAASRSAAMASFVLQRAYGLSAQQFALVFGVNAVGILVAGRLSASLVGRLGAARLLTAGVVVALVASVAMLIGVLVSGSVWVLLVPLLFLVSCTGVLLPNSTALALEGHPSSFISVSKRNLFFDNRCSSHFSWFFNS